MKKIFITICILIMILLSLTGCAEKQDDQSIKNKATSEIDFFETEIFKIVIKLAKGEYDTDNGLNWSSMYQETEKLNSSWSTVVIDLTKLNVPQDQITGLSQDIDNLVIAISDKNENNVIINLYNMYAKLPEFEKIYETDKKKLSERILKRTIFASYVQAKIGEWGNSKNEIQNASNQYNELMKDVEYAKEKKYGLNKILVEIEELKSAIDKENFELVKMKYINLIERM